MKRNRILREICQYTTTRNQNHTKRTISVLFSTLALVAILAATLATGTPSRAVAQENQLPAKPTGFAASSVTYQSVTLTWDDPSDGGITGYQILRRDKAVHEVGKFATLVDDTGSSMTSYTDETVASEGKYVYRVRARNTHGLGPRSSYANVKVPAAPPLVSVSFGQATYSIEEGGTVTVTVALDVAPQRNLSIPLTRTYTGGAVADDLTGVPGTVSFDSGQTTATFTVSATDDSDDDDGEGVVLGLGVLPDRVSAGGYARTIVSIADNDDPADTDATREGAVDLGDITDLDAPRFPKYSLDGRTDEVDYFRFTLTQPKQVGLALRKLDADADLSLEDASGTVLASSRKDNTDSEWIHRTLLEGVYYIRVQAQEQGSNEYALRYGVSDANPDIVAALREPQTPPGVTPGGEGSSEEEPPRVALPATADDDCSETTDTTCALSVGVDHPASIEEVGDVDWIRAPLAAGTSYRIEISTDRNGSDSLPYPDLVGVYGSDGQLLRDTGITAANRFSRSDDGVNTIGRHFRNDVAGDYFIAVRGRQVGPVPAIGNYSVKVLVETSSPDDCSSRETTQSTLVLGVPNEGNLERLGDIDWFKVDLEAGKTYRIAVSGRADLGGIHHTNSENVVSARSMGAHYPSISRTELAWITATESGTHYIEVKPGHSLGSYSLRIEEIPLPNADVPTSTTTTEAIGLGAHRYGRLDTLGDSDWFKIHMTAGASYRLRIEGSADGQGTLDYPRIWGVRDSDAVGMPGTASFSNTINLRPEATGYYYVNIASPAGIGIEDRERTGIFRLSFQLVDGSASELDTAEDCASDTTTKCSVEVDGTANGQISPADDKDWFRTELKADQLYQFRLHYSEGSYTTWVAELRLSDGSTHSTRIRSSRDRQNSDVFAYRPDADGTHFMEVDLQETVTAGSYTVSVAEIDVDEVTDCADSNETVCTVSVGDSVTGYIEKYATEDRDYDRWAVELTAGQAYVIEVKGAGDLTGGFDNGGTIIDPLAELYNSAGTEVAANNNIMDYSDGAGNFNSRITYTVPEGSAGAHYVRVTSGEVALGTYQLSIRLSE